MLLSGAVIGSVNDMSAVFYNPGALGYLIKPELVLSASAYQLRQLNIKDGGGREVDLGSSQINLIPNLVAGSFRFNFHGDQQTRILGFDPLSLQRRDSDERAGQFDLDPDIPGDEFFSGGLSAASISARSGWTDLGQGFG